MLPKAFYKGCGGRWQGSEKRTKSAIRPYKSIRPSATGIMDARKAIKTQPPERRGERGW